MKVLFLSETSALTDTAQLQRLRKLREGLESLGIETSFLALPDMPVGRPTLLFPLNLPFAWSKIRGCDFIHAVGDAAFTALLWKWVSRIPVVYDVDADTLAETHMHWERRKSLQTAFWIFQTAIMNWIAYRSKDYFITVSRPLEDRLANQKGVPRDRLYLVRNGVDTQLFTPSYDGAKGTFTACYAGGFHAWEGIDNLVEAGKLLRGEPIRIKIIGFRHEHRNLKAKIAASLGDMVELVDRVSQPELITHLSRAHVLVIPRLPHPAVEIAFPTKFSEYLAMGKPVIVSDVDETASLVRVYKCGLVSAPGPQAFAETLRKAAALAHSELAEMGRNGRHLAETVFDWQVVCHNYASLLRQWHNSPR